MNRLRFPWLPLFIALAAMPVAASAWWSGQPAERVIAQAAPAHPAALDSTTTVTPSANPGQAIAEISAQNNTLTTSIGGLTPPDRLWAAAAPDQPSIYLSWTVPQDDRIAGYRIYRSTDGGAPVPVGGTFVGGWIDLTSEVGHTYRYQVASYAADRFESAPTEVIQVALRAKDGRRTYLPLVRKQCI